MEFSIKQGAPEKQRSGCVAVGVFEGGKLSDAGLALDKYSKHALSDIIARGDLSGKAEATLLLHNVPHTMCERVLLVGLGKRDEFGARQYRACVRAAMRALQATGTKDAVLYLAELPVAGRNSAWCISQAILAAFETAYRSDHLKSKREKEKKAPHKIQFALLAGKSNAALETALTQAVAVARGMGLAKDLGNLPGNVCTPSYLAQRSEEAHV